jgi:hypothetical protein
LKKINNLRERILLRGNRGKKQSTPKKKQNKTVLSDDSISLHLESRYDIILDSYDRVVPKNNPNIYDYEPESESESDSENEDDNESERVNKKRTNPVAFKRRFHCNEDPSCPSLAHRICP